MALYDLNKTGRILYCSPIDLSVPNGPGVNEREFVTAMYAAIGDRAHFVVPHPSLDMPADVSVDQCSYIKPHNHYHPRHFFSHSASITKTIEKVLSQDKYDLMVFRLGPMPLGFLRLNQISSVPYVLRHLSTGISSSLSKRGGQIGRALSGINRRMISKVARGALVCDVVSHQDIENVSSTYNLSKDRIVWIDNSVNTKRFFPQSSIEAKKLLHLERFSNIAGYVGNYAWRRGAGQLIEAGPTLLKKHPKLGLLVLGGGDGIVGLQQRAKELGIASQCVFTGQVAFDLVPAYVNALDVGVSILEPAEFAASEQKVRQYLACGKPVVATPGSNDFLPQHGLGSLVDTLDISGIATEIDRWLSMTDTERGQLQSNAIDYTNTHFAADRMMASRLQLWGDLLDKKEHRKHD